MKLFYFFISLFLSVTIFSQVGIGTDTPKSSLDVNGTVNYKVVNYNGGPGGSATALEDGFYLNLTPTSGNVEFYLPTESAIAGRMYIMRNISSSENAIIYWDGTHRFFPKDSSTSSTSVTLNANSAPKTLIFIFDGANWTYL